MDFHDLFWSRQTFEPSKGKKTKRYNEIICYSDEAIYIYSVNKLKIVYAKGWDNLLGYSNNEISMQMLLKITTPEFVDYLREMHKQVINFIVNETEHLFEYSFTYETKKYNKENKEISLLESFKVFNTKEDGSISEFVGTYKLNPRISNFREKYLRASGPGIEHLINRMLCFGTSEILITPIEREVIKLLVEGKSILEVAKLLNKSKSTIEKIINQLCTQFNVKGSKQLISYAIKNGLA